MTFWSGETLAQRLPGLVTSFDPSNIDCNAYTLRMGAEYYCTSDGKRPIWKRAKKASLKARETFVIPAGQFAFLETKEEITIPREVMAFISMKATVKWDGLINVSGFHVDPGYKGKLLFAVYNAGPSPIVLEEGMPLFLIWYAHLDNPETKQIRALDSGKTISRDLIKRMSGEILSLQSLSEEIATVRFSMRVQAAIFGAAAVIFLGVIVGVAAFILQRPFASILDSPGALLTRGASNSSVPTVTPQVSPSSGEAITPATPTTSAPRPPDASNPVTDDGKK